MVAFSAGVQKPQSVSKDGTIIFEDMKANNGDKYSPVTGKFTCPITGYYLFYFTIHRDHASKYDLSVELVKNGFPVTHATSMLHLEDALPLQTASSNMAIIMCEEGEVVWVRAIDFDQTVYAYQAPLSSFSGVLLSKRFEIDGEDRQLVLYPTEET